LCRRGHRLLKQKQDELMRVLTQLIDEVRDMRKEAEEKLAAVFRLFLMAESVLGVDVMENVVSFLRVETRVELEEKRFLNLRMHELSTKIGGNIHNYGFLRTNGDLDMGISKFAETLPGLIKLHEVEKKLHVIAEEVERTRRRVNALEHILIPDIEETIKSIIMKLEEMEIAGHVRLMKVKGL